MQLPTGTPKPDANQAVDFENPFEIIVYIVVPLVMILFYILLRKKYRKDKGENSNNK